MAIWDRLFQKSEKRSNSGIKSPDLWLQNIFGGKVNSGITVNEVTALKYSAVFSCVRILSETIATLPCILHQKTPDGKSKATQHPIYNLLHDQANTEQTAYQWKAITVSHMALWGNAYSFIERNTAGYPIGLWPLLPSRMQVWRDFNQQIIVYNYILPDGRMIRMDPANLLHLWMFSIDGILGLSPIGYQREAIGLGLAMEEFGARYFSNGTNTGAVISHPGQMSDQSYKHLKDSMNEKYEGLGKSHKLMILEEAMKFEKIGIPPEDSQFLQSREFQVVEIARIYRVPPHMIADLSKATFSNIEHQSLEFINYTISPWITNIEQIFNSKLLSTEERVTYFAEFLVSALLRGDIKSRYEAYSIGRQNGWLSANDVRELENMNRIDGGDIYLSPLNMIPASELENYYKK